MLRIEETCVREAGLSSVKASRLLLESVTIVGSILLAFAIDAWWDGRSHDTLVREQRAALAAQMRANQALLTRAADAASGSLQASQQLVRLIGPAPTMVSPDSLGTLINAGLSSIGMQEPELGAVVLRTARSLAAQSDSILVLLNPPK